MWHKASGIALYNAWGVTRFLAIFQQYKISAPGKNQSGERVRNLLRNRESMAGCRGAVLTKCFVAAGSMAVLQNIPCPTVHLFTPSDRYSVPGVIQVRRIELGFKGVPFGTRMCNADFPRVYIGVVPVFQKVILPKAHSSVCGITGR